MARAPHTMFLFIFATSLLTVAASACSALYLSPLIEQGRIELAQQLSRVTSDTVESYSGYITVDNRYDSNLFFWFLPTQNTRAPVVLWLNGGPGVPSMIGAFLENGPLAFNGEDVEHREVAWTQHFSMLYVDNPVGTGYSFTRNESGMARSREDVAVNLYSLLVQFFQMFPQFSTGDFYIGGQSYACKYVSALGPYIHEQNHGIVPPEVFINMKGIYMGGGFCDPISMLPVFPDTLYTSGLISEYERETYQHNINRMLQRAVNTNYTSKDGDFDIILGKAREKLTCQGDLDNLLGCEATNARLVPLLEEHLLTDAVLEWFHVEPMPTGVATGFLAVQDYINPRDLFRGTSGENAFLMDNYKVLHYTGNLDLLTSVAMTETFLQHVQWWGQQEYGDSQRQQWVLNGTLAGWFNHIGNFTRVVVRNAGHMVPYDQPESALDMMKRFIFDKDFGQ